MFTLLSDDDDNLILVTLNTDHGTPQMFKLYCCRSIFVVKNNNLHHVMAGTRKGIIPILVGIAPLKALN